MKNTRTPQVKDVTLPADKIQEASIIDIELNTDSTFSLTLPSNGYEQIRLFLWGKRYLGSFIADGGNHRDGRYQFLFSRIPDKSPNNDYCFRSSLQTISNVSALLHPQTNT